MRELLLGTAHVDRGSLLWWAGVRAGLVTGALVLAFVVSGQQSYALPVAVGAIFVAIADAGETVGRRWRTMLWANAWLMGATLLGGVGGNHAVLGVLMAAVISFVCGFVGAAGSRAGLIGVLTLVIYIVFNGAPESERLVVDSALVVGLGGVVMAVVTVAPHVFRPLVWRVALEPVTPFRERLRGRASLDDTFMRHGVRLALVVTVATIVADVTPWPHDYWLPMTVAWVTKPDADGTVSKIVARVAGTIAGVLVTAAVVDGLRVTEGQLSVLVGVAAGIAVLFIWANYAIAVVGITFIVVGLFSFDGDPVAETMWLRIAATIVAGFLAFLSFYVWPSVRPGRIGAGMS